MSKDTCIKANTYCPVHKGIVGADCWHDSKDFSVPRTDWKQVDEINTLREQVEKLTEECVVLRASNKTKLDTISYLETREDDNQQKLAALAEQNKRLRNVMRAVAEAVDYYYTEKSADRYCFHEALSLPDLASPILNKYRAGGTAHD